MLAQNKVIRGKVFAEQSKAPLIQSHVFIPGTTFQTFTDSLGQFSLIGMPPGNWNVVAAKEGFNLLEKEIILLQEVSGPNTSIQFLLSNKTKSEENELSLKQQKRLQNQFLSWMKLGSNEQLILVNPEVLRFQKDQYSKAHWVYSEEALLFQNLQTSYLISMHFKQPIQMEWEFNPRDFLLSYLEIKPGNDEENKLITENRIRTYEQSPIFELRKLIGVADGQIEMQPSDQKGQFLLNLNAPLLLENGEKSLAFKNEELLIRSNGSPVYPENLITTGFIGSKNPLLEMPLDFDYDQSRALSTLERTPESLAERVFLHTDKDVYLMGEEMFFKAYLLYGDPLLVHESSKVLHVEILDSSGYSMVHRIFPIENGMAQGKISLTPDFYKRDFLVKSYTLWGANYGSEFEYYKPIQVYTNFPKIEIEPLTVLSEGITLFSDKEVYQDQDSVTLNIISRNKYGAISGANLSVSVLSEFTMPLIKPEKSVFVSFADSIPKIKDKEVQSFFLEKEMGYTLKGKIKDENVLVEKSIVEVLVDTFLDKREVIADKNGVFYISGIYHTGDFSVLVKARNNIGKQLEEFELDLLRSPNKLDISSMGFPNFPIENRPLQRVDSLQRSYLALRKGEILLQEVEVKDTRKVDSRSMPFGRAPISLEMEDVFLTGDTQQFIYSIVNRTGLRAGGIPPMIINPRGYPGGPPVILLNGTPITSILGSSIGNDPREDQYRALQSINVFTIEKIEVIKSIIPVLGEAGKFGAINIITKMGQYVASNEKPYQEFKLKGLEEPQSVRNPLYSFTSSTLYWNPEVKIYPNQTSTTLKFKLPEKSEAFWVIVNGINASGEPVSGRFLLNEKKTGSN